MARFMNIGNSGDQAAGWDSQTKHGILSVLVITQHGGSLSQNIPYIIESHLSFKCRKFYCCLSEDNKDIVDIGRYQTSNINDEFSTSSFDFFHPIQMCSLPPHDSLSPVASFIHGRVFAVRLECVMSWSRLTHTCSGCNIMDWGSLKVQTMVQSKKKLEIWIFSLL